MLHNHYADVAIEGLASFYSLDKPLNHHLNHSSSESMLSYVVHFLLVLSQSTPEHFKRLPILRSFRSLDRVLPKCHHHLLEHSGTAFDLNSATASAHATSQAVSCLLCKVLCKVIDQFQVPL